MGDKMVKYQRFESLLDDEMVYIADKKDLKELDDFIKEVTNEYRQDYSEEETKERFDEIEEIAVDRYDDYLYENSLTGAEILNLLNSLYGENIDLKEENQKLRELLFDPRRITNEVVSND